MANSKSPAAYWNTAREVIGARREEVPDPRDPTAKVYTERFIQALSAYSRAARGTEHATKSGFYFVRDDELEVREGLKTFERVWATIPATRSEPITITYPYPGYLDERDPPSLGVFGRVLLEFFLSLKPEYRKMTGATGTAATDVIASSGHPFENGDPITYVSGTGFGGLVAGTVYYARDVVAGVSFKVADTAGGAAKDITSDGTAGVFSRGIAPNEAQRYTNTYGDIMILTNGGAGVLITSPTLTAYKALVSASSEINAADSEVEPYMGDIWCRKTIKIPAR